MIPELRPGVQAVKPHMLSMDGKVLAAIQINIASNESAFGPSPAAVRAASAAISEMERYADGAEIALATEIAAHHALNPKGVVCGNGSDDLLARLARAFLRPGDELICSVNGYQKIPNYAYFNDAVPVRAPDNDFTADVDQLLSCLTERSRIVMIANPDNPTGTWVSGTQIRRLHAGLPSDVLLVLDSAYLEYVENAEFENPAALVEEFENVVMTRTFSKIYGLAGIRLGWLYAPEKIADAVRRIGLTFPISGVAFESGKAALNDQAHVATVLERNRAGKIKFASTLEQLGARVIPSQTNFLLAQFPAGELSAPRVHEALLNRGIFTRRMAARDFSSSLRFTIGTEQEMELVTQSLMHLFGDT